MLKFLGRGAAFNPKEGNNSAFTIENNQMFLIDCGENIFERIMNVGVLNDISNINIFITHTHSDHVGSLGSLVMYSYFVKKQPLNILISEEMTYLSNIKKILEGFGCTEAMYNFTDIKFLDNKFESFDSARYLPTHHCDELDSCGILFHTKDGIVYYSGDTNEIKIVKSLIESNVKIDKIYVDATTADYPGNVHLSLRILNENIPREFRDRVYCMHFNSDECIEKAQLLGFKTVEIEKKDQLYQK